MATHKETMKLIEDYQNGSEKSLETLIEDNTALVVKIASSYRNKGQTQEDLLQIGITGLIKSIQKFDTTRGVRFSTYAYPSIKGALDSFFRHEGNPIHVPKGIRDVRLSIYRNELLDSSPEYISEVLDKPLDLVNDTLEYIHNNLGSVKSIEDKAHRSEEGADLYVKDQLSSDVNKNWFEKMTLNQALGNLKDVKLREVIQLKYFKDKSQRDIAKIMKTSQSQISRLEKQALEKLKRLMNGEESEEDKKEKRKEKAIKLLKETNLTQREIAEETGVPQPTVGGWSLKYRSTEVSQENIRRLNKRGTEKKQKTTA